jgi:glycosyltransferase involved in cell wall biosynthesis
MPAHERLIIHQFDPEVLQPGGIDTCISDLIAHAPPEMSIALVGSTEGARRVGVWTEVDHRGKKVPFLPVVRLSRSEPRRIPHSAAVAAGLARWRSQIPGARCQFHRIDLAAAGSAVLSLSAFIQLIHNPHGRGVGVVGHGSDSFWRFAPYGYRRLEDRVLRRAERIAVFSAGEAERLRMRGHAALRFRTWFDSDTFFHVTKSKPDVLRIAVVGRLENQKDPLLALAAVREIARRGVPVQATFLGDGRLRSELRREARNSGIARQVSLPGAGSRTDVASLLHESDVLLLTSHYEGSPRIVIESLATGTPVAATSGADPDKLAVDGRTGAHATARTPAAVADAVLRASTCDSRTCADAVSDLRADLAVPSLLRATDTATEAAAA